MAIETPEKEHPPERSPPEESGGEGAPPASSEDPLGRAFEALVTYGWGEDPAVLRPIDEAVFASRADPARRRELEARLISVLSSEAPRAAKDFVCRKLSRMGSAASVPALAGLLADPSLSHMARWALERIPCSESATALFEALREVKDSRLRAGVINSLGARRHAASAARLASLLRADSMVAGAAAAALGRVATREAAEALLSFRKEAPEELRGVLADACLECAEGLLGRGERALARAIYSALQSSREPGHVRRAAARGLSAAAGAE